MSLHASSRTVLPPEKQETSAPGRSVQRSEAVAVPFNLGPARRATEQPMASHLLHTNFQLKHPLLRGPGGGYSL